MSDNDFEAQLEQCEADAQALTEENFALRAERDEAIEALRDITSASSLQNWLETPNIGMAEFLRRESVCEQVRAILSKHPRVTP